MEKLALEFPCVDLLQNNTTVKPSIQTKQSSLGYSLPTTLVQCQFVTIRYQPQTEAVLSSSQILLLHYILTSTP